MPEHAETGHYREMPAQEQMPAHIKERKFV
jgi:hypothetical protein